MDLTEHTWDELKKVLEIEGSFIPAEPKYDTLAEDKGAEGVFKPSHYTGGSIETIEMMATDLVARCKRLAGVD